jgi:hypothetical protein
MPKPTYPVKLLNLHLSVSLRESLPTFKDAQAQGVGETHFEFKVQKTLHK